MRRPSSSSWPMRLLTRVEAYSRMLTVTALTRNIPLAAISQPRSSPWTPLVTPTLIR